MISSSLQNYDIQASQKDGDVNINKIVKLDEMEMENQKNCNILLSKNKHFLYFMILQYTKENIFADLKI